MGFNLGLLAGVLYAKQMGAEPNRRLKKHYEKCRNRNHKKNALRMYGWRLGHLILVLALVYLQYLLYSAVQTQLQPQPTSLVGEEAFRNNSVLISEESHHLHLRASSQHNQISMSRSYSNGTPSSIVLLQTLLALFNLWLLSEAQFRVATVDRGGLTVSHFQLLNNHHSYHRLDNIRKVEIIRKGVSRFSQQTQQYALRLTIHDNRTSHVELS